MTLRFEDPPRTSQCFVTRLIESLPSAESEALRTMVSSDLTDWSHADIHRALQEEGHPSSYNQIGTHRRKQCGCYS